MEQIDDNLAVQNAIAFLAIDTTHAYTCADVAGYVKEIYAALSMHCGM